MEISNSSANLPINGQINGGTKVQSSVNKQQDFVRVQVEKDNNSLQEKQKQKARLDIDPQAIELIQQQEANQVSQQANQQQRKSTSYDQPSEQNHTAIAAYQSVENQSQRDNIQQVFGVDLLA